VTADVRRAVLRSFGAGPAEAEELLRYNANAFVVPAAPCALPLPDEPFVREWDEYAADAARRGAVPVLRERLPQLRFPIAAGISATEAYRAATRRGIASPPDAPPLAWCAPDGVTLFVRRAAGGRIPVLLVEDRRDFVSLVRALTARNEPVPVPASQGAAMIAGYNNWSRIADLRAAFERGEALPGLSDGVAPATRWRSWDEAFAAIRERPRLYQDHFVLLSSGPYSGVDGRELGVTAEAWRRLSCTIRLEHECAHYFTRRVFGSMRNALLDELMADYVGIAAAVGRYRADWFLRIMGLEVEGSCRPGGRIENYRRYGDLPPLSDGAFAVLHALVRCAAAHLQEADTSLGADVRGVVGRARMVTALAMSTLEELAAPGAAARLIELVAARARGGTNTGGGRAPTAAQGPALARTGERRDAAGRGRRPSRRPPRTGPRGVAYTAGDTLDLVAAHVPHTLVNRAHWAELRRGAERLPAGIVHAFYLECRLGGVVSPVDLIVRVDAAGREILAGRSPLARVVAPPDCRRAWARIGRFCEAWSDDPRLRRTIAQLWFEFDMAKCTDVHRATLAPAPSVFIGFKSAAVAGLSADGWRALMDTVLAHLAPEAARAGAGRTVLSAIMARPAGTPVPFLGVMLGRPVQAVRLYLANVSASQIPSTVRGMGWPGDAGELTALLDAVAGPPPGVAPRVGMLHVDLDGEILPKLGVEYTLERREQVRGRLVETCFLDRLVELGLCAADKRDALASWPGHAVRALPHELWTSVVARRVNCIKVLIHAGGPPEAKGYLLTHWATLASLPGADRRRRELAGRAGER